MSDELVDFFAAYFHEDWDLDAPDAAGVVTVYMNQNPDPHLHRRVAAAIEQFVREHPDGDALDAALFNKLGCYYLPSGDGKSTPQWLAEIVAQLAHKA